MPSKTRPLKVRSHIKPEPVVIDGVRFDSRSEAKRAGELKLLQRAGSVRNLEFHPTLPLFIRGEKTGKVTKIGIGRIALDFKYEEFEDGAWRTVYEDHKPVMTDNSKTRIAIAEALHEIKIKLTGH